MRILTRYVVFDLLSVFFLTLTAMTAIVFVGLVGKQAVEHGVGLVPLLRMVPFLLPEAFQYTLPGTMLLATTTVYGRMSSSNEIVAIKSLGISPTVMIWPTLVVATLVSFSAVWVNDMAVSWGHNGVQKIFFDSLEEIIYGRLRTTRSFDSDVFDVTVQRVQDRRLLQPTIIYRYSADDPPITLTADEAELKADAGSDKLILQLINAEGDSAGVLSAVLPGKTELSIPLSEFFGNMNRTRSPSNYALYEIVTQKVEQAAAIETLEQEMATEAACAMMTGQMYELGEESWNGRRAQVAHATVTLKRFYTEPHRRWANGFSCLCFVMIGAPMAIWRRHGEFWGSFFMCFAPILLLYYPLLVGCLDMAKRGVLPSPSVWLGNLVLAGLGYLLMRRIVRF
jgi:lipopolysaccharide export system permease protein